MLLTFEEALQNARDFYEEQDVKSSGVSDEWARAACPLIQDLRLQTTEVFFSPEGDDIPF